MPERILRGALEVAVRHTHTCREVGVANVAISREIGEIPSSLGQHVQSFSESQATTAQLIIEFD